MTFSDISINAASDDLWQTSYRVVQTLHWNFFDTKPASDLAKIAGRIPDKSVHRKESLDLFDAKLYFESIKPSSEWSFELLSWTNKAWMGK